MRKQMKGNRQIFGNMEIDMKQFEDFAYFHFRIAVYQLFSSVFRISFPIFTLIRRIENALYMSQCLNRKIEESILSS